MKKYPRPKHQTDHEQLSVLFEREPERYRKLAKSMHWLTGKTKA